MFRKIHKKYNVEMNETHEAFSLNGEVKKQTGNRAISQERLKLLKRGLSGILISHDGMLKVIEDAGLLTRRCDNILHDIYKRKMFIERKKRNQSNYIPPKGYNFKMFCIINSVF